MRSSQASDWKVTITIMSRSQVLKMGGGDSPPRCVKGRTYYKHAIRTMVGKAFHRSRG